MSRRASANKNLVSNSLSKVVHPHIRGPSITAAPTSQEDSSNLVCLACQAGPFSYQGFRQAVLEAHYKDTTGYCYTRPWSEISQSVSDEDCNWCRIVIRTRDGLPPDKFPYEAKIAEVRLQVDAGPVRTGLAIYINGYKAAYYTIYAKKGNSAVKDIGIENSIFSNESYVDYQKALEAVKNCNDHEHCSTIEETTLPTRVIDCSDPTKPRLVETHRQVRGHYCTLSYVWGQNQTQKTTTSNIATYTSEGINVPLPQTIADAILVTNKLGVQYLWVDTLCIIQDSDEDKIQELGIMGNIYRDAYLTISVLSAFRADHGFIPDARGPDVLPFYLANKSKSPGQMLAEYDIPHETPGAGKYETVKMHRPLDERGWCFQESVLSPRRLIFQPPNVSYKCRSFQERYLSRLHPLEQHGGSQDEEPYPANDHILFPNNKNLAGKRAAIEVDKQELREEWRSMLLDYSEREITVSSDKFVAFSSVVEIFQSHLQDQYIAGLWRQNLLYDLLWEVCQPMGPDEVHLPRPEVYRAPTWSWASVDGHLAARDFELDPPPSAMCYEVDIVACEATPKNNSLPFGEITDAKLTIRAKVHPLMRDGSKCTFITKKGGRSGNQYASTSTSWSWNPPAGNCLEPIGPRAVVGKSDEEPESDEESDGDEEPEINEDSDSDDVPEDDEEGDSGGEQEGNEERDDNDEEPESDDEENEEGVEGIRFDSLEGTEQDREMDFYVIILRAGRKWKNQGDWMQGFLALRVEGEVEQYRRVGVLDLQYDFQWPDWFDDMPLKTVTIV